MGRRNYLQNSTYPDLGGSWLRANITDNDIRWAKLNLVPGKTQTCKFECSKGFKRTDSIPSSGGSLPPSWESRVHFRSGEQHPWVLVELGERYNLRDLRLAALEKRDPQLAPHVFFRKLAPGNDAMALAFLKEFGPLFCDNMERNPVMWIDLNDFWRRHARYAAILRLYESYDDYDLLREVIVDLAANAPTLDQAGDAAIGMIPHTHKGHPFVRTVDLQASDAYKATDEDGDPFYPHQYLKGLAGDLIESELILHTYKDLGSSWFAVEDDDEIKFRPERVILSLWAGMWEMFGLDTWSGSSWKVCRICGKYFYPLQRNSDCCKPEHQALWSKRIWARNRRQKMKKAGLEPPMDSDQVG
jgi:hypothetical protein